MRHHFEHHNENITANKVTGERSTDAPDATMLMRSAQRILMWSGRGLAHLVDEYKL